MEHDSFLEVRDCKLQSVRNSDDELITRDCEDSCFALNFGSFTSRNPDDDFEGLLNVQSCSITGFYHCVLAGVNSTVNVDRSSLLQARGSAVSSLNPKVLCVTSSRLERAFGHGVEVNWLAYSSER